MHIKFTIKSYVAVFLIVIAGSALSSIQNYSLFTQLAFAPILAATIDIVIDYVKEKKLILPSSAIISGLFIALILPPASVTILFAAALIAILSKHIIKIKGRHIFNPAAFGIIVSSLIFGYAVSWWAAISLLVIPFGLFVIYKQKKWRLALSFLIVYFLLVMLSNIASLSAFTLLDTTAIFFAFFMLIEPMTSTYTKKGMLIQGVFVGILAFVLKAAVPVLDFFLLALLISNIFVGKINKKFI